MPIRSATLEDIDHLVSLGKRTFYDAFVDNQASSDMTEYLREAFSHHTIEAQLLDPNSHFLLVYEATIPHSPPMGYARLLENSSEPCIAGETVIELVRLYVEQAAIGKGYGAALMKACLEYAANQEFETIWLGVWENNHRAQRFYQRWGFERVGSHGFRVGQDLQTDWILARPVRLALNGLS